MSRSHKANHYGTLVERKAAERYNLELDRAAGMRDNAGRSVRSKSVRDASARRWAARTFTLSVLYHERLRAANGWYVFGVYRVRGRGVEVLEWNVRHSSRLPRLEWHGGGEHRDARQAKIKLQEFLSSAE